MGRIAKPWDVKFLEVAMSFAEQSHCAAKGVACVIVKDGGIIATGINGTLPGTVNCDQIYNKDHDFGWHKRTKENDFVFYRIEDQNEHHEWSKKNEIHAEINALARANKLGVSVEGATAYITYSPCHACALALASFGIKRVVYAKRYDNSEEVRRMLVDYNVEVDVIML